MASLKIIRKRISSVKSTQQITKAMKMVAAAKLRRAQEAATQARPYADKLGELLRTVAGRVPGGSQPAAGGARRGARRRSDRRHRATAGCAAATTPTSSARRSSFCRRSTWRDVRLTIVGRKALELFPRSAAVDVVDNHIGLRGGPDHDLAALLGARVARDYAAGETDAVYVLYNHFRSALSQVPTVERVLPVVAETAGEESLVDYIYEPQPAQLLDRLLRTVRQHADLPRLPRVDRQRARRRA